MYFSVSNRFNTTNSKSLSLTRLVRITKYISNPSIFITTIYSILITFSFADSSTLLSSLLPYGFVGLIWIFLLVIRNLFEYLTCAKISTPTITRSKYIILLFSRYGLFITLNLAMLIFYYFFTKLSYNSRTSYLIALISFAAVMLSVTFTISTFILKKSLKNQVITDNPIKANLQEMLNAMGYKRIHIEILKNENSHFIKAAVIASKNGVIYLSQDIMDNLSPDEIKSVVAHEVGHIRYKHSLKTGLSVFLGLIITQSLLITLPTIFYWFEFESIFIICIGFLTFYFGIILNFLSRKHEHEADKFVLKQGYSSETFKAALLKIEKLIGQDLDFFEFEYIFLSHPSLKSRINYIKKFEYKL